MDMNAFLTWAPSNMKIFLSVILREEKQMPDHSHVIPPLRI